MEGHKVTDECGYKIPQGFRRLQLTGKTKGTEGRRRLWIWKGDEIEG